MNLRVCRRATKWQLIPKPLIEIYGNGAAIRALPVAILTTP